MSQRRKAQRQAGRRKQKRVAIVTDHNLQGNYCKKLQELTNEVNFPPGSTTDVFIYHDDWCGIYRDKACNCDPWIRTEPLSQ